MLANAGYDVWLGNNRGNYYSREHTSLHHDGDDEERKEYWDFSFHEMAEYDIPATLDYILTKTEQ